MANVEFPNTESKEVARMAVTLNIVLQAGFSSSSPKNRLTDMVTAYIETYNAILANERERRQD